jgi:hypothetical protein
MKRIITISLIAMAFVLPAVGGAFLEYFHANSDSDNIVLSWRTRSESNMNMFEIERKSSQNGSFSSLAQITPKGSNSTYTYTDRSAFKSSATTYIYRLKISDGSGNPGYSQEVEVKHSVSSVKRTWGSIKAMFR